MSNFSTTNTDADADFYTNATNVLMTLMADTDDQAEQSGYTQSEKIALSMTARVAGGISFLSGLYIFVMAWKRRDHVYHRLMLGTCTVYLYLYIYVHTCYVLL